MPTLLFLCTGNSCRSILAEATFNHLAPAGWHAVSAGSHPTGVVHPRALALLEREGIDTSTSASTSWERLEAVPDAVVTVCSDAAGETCPVYLAPVVRAHWGVDDPARAVGTDAEIDAAFARAYTVLRARIETFLAGALDEAATEPAALRAALERAGRVMRPADGPADAR